MVKGEIRIADAAYVQLDRIAAVLAGGGDIWWHMPRRLLGTFLQAIAARPCLQRLLDSWRVIQRKRLMLAPMG